MARHGSDFSRQIGILRTRLDLAAWESRKRRIQSEADHSTSSVTAEGWKECLKLSSKISKDIPDWLQGSQTEQGSSTDEKSSEALDKTRWTAMQEICKLMQRQFEESIAADP